MKIVMLMITIVSLFYNVIDLIPALLTYSSRKYVY